MHLDRVNLEWLRVDTIGFDDSHGVTINGENVVGVTGKRDEAETVALASYNVDDRQRGLCNGTAVVPAPKAVDKMRVRVPGDCG
jgi:hypothetical protein